MRLKQGQFIVNTRTFYDVTSGDTDVDCASPNRCLANGTVGVLSTLNTVFAPAYGTRIGCNFATGIGTVNAINTILLKAAAALAPDDVTLDLYDGLGDLPHFNPDLDKESPHVAVAEFRLQLRNAAGVIISTPEYAHGVPGVLKNAFDWLVASGELYEKPVALFSASPRANYAQASLVETLTVMCAKIVPEACIALPLLGKNLDEDGIVTEPGISRTVRSALLAFTQATSLQEQR